MNELLDTHCKPKQSTFADKAKFFGAMKHPDESVGEWAERLRSLSSNCDFGATLDTNLRDRFILGLGPGPAHDKLFEQDTSTLTFSRALELAEEAIFEAKTARKEEPTSPAKAINVSSERSGACAVFSQQTLEPVCSVCGFKNHKESECRYKSYKCHNCGKQGHLKRMCGAGEGSTNANKKDEADDGGNRTEDAAREERQLLYLNLSSRRSSRSCETCCCMRIETAGYIFAVINAMIVTTGTLFSLGFFGMMLRMRLDPDQTQEQGANSSSLFLPILSVVCLVGTIIAEVFAVLLCVGISKKNPGFVMTYLIYGITVEILSVTGIVCFIWLSWGRWDLVIYSATLLVVCGIYALPLLLVKQTYKVLSESSLVEHTELVYNQTSRATCCGMRVETGGFIFAIINAIIVTAGTLCCISFFAMMLRIRLDPDKMQEHATNSLFLTILSAVCLVGAVIAEVFAVLLCVGISKKKPRFVLAYLVYGVSVEILSVIGIVCFIWLSWGRWDLVIYSATLLVVCGIYALPLLLVKKTYIVLSNSSPEGLTELINNQYDF